METSNPEGNEAKMVVVIRAPFARPANYNKEWGGMIDVSIY